MGELYFNTDDEGREELKALYIRLGGDAKEWDNKMRRLDSDVESLEEIGRLISRPPHYRGKPGKSYRE